MSTRAGRSRSAARGSRTTRGSCRCGWSSSARSSGLVAYVAAQDGSFVPIRLARNEGPRPTILVVPVPAAARGGRLVAFRLEPPPKLEERGADSGAPAVGSVELGPPRVDGRPLTDYGDWVGTVGADHLQRGRALRFHVTLTNEVDTYLRPRQPTDGLQIPAVVSPFLATLAGPDRVLGVTVNGEQLQFRVVGVAQRFPDRRRRPASWSPTGPPWQRP